jgi:hypothetical protein
MISVPTHFECNFLWVRSYKRVNDMKLDVLSRWKVGK